MRGIHFFLLPAIFSIFSLGLLGDIIGQKATYTLNDDPERTSWLLKSGDGEAIITSFKEDEKLGPSYVVTINYDFDVMIYGRQKGSIGLLVPASMFEDKFYDDLKKVHPVNLGGFKVDYEGMSEAADAKGNEYEECMVIRIFDVDPNFQPFDASKPSISVLWHYQNNPSVILEDLEITAKTHPSVSVMRAVQFDISGKAYGFDLAAGLDLVL